MNEYNHHRIIDAFALRLHLDPQIVKVLKDASTFADDIKAEFSYFFYHFYYDIKVKNSNTLIMPYVNKQYNYNQSVDSMTHCGEKELIPYGLIGWDPSFDEKEFFSSINERKKSNHRDFLDIGNQSDNVAFLHAMAAEGETREKAQGKFEEHLKNCFAEYLFLTNEDDALFMLGIALHGIMDSFTPSHTNFQKYTEQDMIDKYGHSIKEAEEAALKFFNSDEGYECSTTVSDEELYIVTVTDTFDNTKYVFEVDPATLNAVLK